MNKDAELQRLEQFVEKLLAKFSELKDQKAQLEKELSERNALIAELQNNISNKDEERVEISTRVNKIVGQIEAWELALDEEADEPAEEVVAQDDDAAGDDVADVDAEVEEEELQEEVEGEEGRVQHNLFSMSE